MLNESGGKSGCNLLVREPLPWSNLGLLFWRAAEENVWVETGRSDAIAGTAAHCPFGAAVFITFITSRITANVALKRRGARGKSGHDAG
jgi:hypothetical protein